MAKDQLQDFKTQQNILRYYNNSRMGATELPATYNIYEDQLDETIDVQLPQNVISEQQHLQARRMRKEARMQARRQRRAEREANKQEVDPYYGMSRKERRELLRKEQEQKLALESVTEFKHRSYNDFVAEQQAKEPSLDFSKYSDETVGGKLIDLAVSWLNTDELSSNTKTDSEKDLKIIRAMNPLGNLVKLPSSSLVNRAADTVVEWFNPDFHPKDSIAGREIARQEILKEIESIGPAMLSEKDKVKRLKELWDKNHILRLENERDQMMLEADAPSIAEIANAIVERPKETGFALLQGIVDSPELALIPQLTGARGASLAATASKAVGLGTKATQVTKVAGGLTAAGLGGFSVGVIDNVLNQSSKTGHVDLFKALEQSQTDALLGAVFYGGGKVLTKGVTTVAERNKRYRQAKIDATDSISTRNLKDAGFYKALKDRVDNAEPATEFYADMEGNVYHMEVKELLNLESSKKEILGLRNKYSKDLESMKYLDGELEKLNNKIKSYKDKGVPIDLLETKFNYESKLAEIEPNQQMLEKLFASAEREGVDTHNFIQMTDTEGVQHTLRRITPDMFRLGEVKIDGLPGITLNNEFKIGKNPNDLVTRALGAFGSATAPIRNLAKSSPTAKLLYDKFNPSSAKGRANLVTMQESVKMNQGKFLMKSREIIETLDKESNMSSTDTHRALMEHMRKVNVSEDPAIIKAADSYRALLDEVNNYVTSKGVKIDYAEDFLPRYYNQKALNTPEARKKLVDSVMEKYPNKTREEVERSVLKIKENLKVDSDEATLIATEGKVLPIGYRKWKNVPDEVLHNYLDDNFIGSLERYMLNTVVRTEAESVFGFGGSKLSIIKAQVAKELDELAGGPNVVGARRITEAESNAIDDLYLLAVGAYGGRTNKSLKALTDGAMAFSNIVSLPLVTLTSASEPLSMLFRFKEESGIKALLDTYTELPVIRKIKASFGDMSYQQKVKEFQEITATNDVAVSERVLAITGEGLQGWPAKINNKFMHLTMLHNWTQLNRRMAYEASKRDILKSIKGIVKGDKPEMDNGRRTYLSDLGIDPDIAASWVRNGASIDSPVYNNIKAGALRLTNTVIADPDKFNKAKVLSSNNSLLRIIGQYKAFNSTFVNTVMGSTYNDIVKMYNAGDKMMALKKFSAAVATMSGMAMWMTYNRDIAFNDGQLKEDKGQALVNNFISMSVPGAGVLAPLYDQYGTKGFVGPLGNIIDRTRKDPTKVSPAFQQLSEFIDKKL